MEAWHFLRDDGCTGYGALRPTVGETLKVSGRIVPCLNGLHASVRALDALQYAPGSLLCRVELSGSIVEHNGDKVVAPKRKILWMYDASSVLHSFACDEAEAFLIRKNEILRTLHAPIEAKRKWLQGKIKASTLNKAYSKARVMWIGTYGEREPVTRVAMKVASESVRETIIGVLNNVYDLNRPNIMLNRRLEAALIRGAKDAGVIQ